MKFYSIHSIFLVALLALGGCVTNGVTPEQYFATQQQISGLQRRIADLQAEQGTLKARIEELKQAPRLPSGVAAVPAVRRDSGNPMPNSGAPIDAHNTGNMGSMGYQDALSRYKAGDIAGAITQFDQLINTGGVSGAEAILSQYWLGDAYFNQRNYDMASRYLGAYLKASPQGNHAQSALTKLVQSLQAIGRAEDAEFLMQEGVNALQ